VTPALTGAATTRCADGSDTVLGGAGNESAEDVVELLELVNFFSINNKAFDDGLVQLDADGSAAGGTVVTRQWRTGRRRHDAAGHDCTFIQEDAVDVRLSEGRSWTVGFVPAVTLRRLDFSVGMKHSRSVGRGRLRC
jgi:hypothetical protein